jgi:hypothetical protein
MALAQPQSPSSGARPLASGATSPESSTPCPLAALLQLLTVDQYSGEGSTPAFGILGCNEGLRPYTLFFDASVEWKRGRGVFDPTRSYVSLTPP